VLARIQALPTEDMLPKYTHRQALYEVSANAVEHKGPA
jgi:hypothetical protein